MFSVAAAAAVSWSNSFMGRVKLSKELMEERGETGRLERRWRGSKWPWKKISSAGDKSMAAANGGGGEDLVLLSGSFAAVEGWREMVKENSWEGDDEAEGELMSCPCCFVCCTSLLP